VAGSPTADARVLADRARLAGHEPGDDDHLDLHLDLDWSLRLLEPRRPPELPDGARG
jgi:hypothetical protein